MKQIILTAVLLACLPPLFAQRKGKCIEICSTPDEQAYFESRDNVALFKYFNDTMSRILNYCGQSGDMPITSLYMNLTIDTSGKIISVAFSRFEAGKECQNSIANTLLNMHGWKPAIKQGRPVCSEFSWPIGCLLWE